MTLLVIPLWLLALTLGPAAGGVLHHREHGGGGQLTAGRPIGSGHGGLGNYVVPPSHDRPGEEKLRVIKITRTYAIPYPVPVPYPKQVAVPVPVSKPVPYPVPHPVAVAIPKPILVPHPVAVGYPSDYLKAPGGSYAAIGGGNSYPGGAALFVQGSGGSHNYGTGLGNGHSYSGGISGNQGYTGASGGHSLEGLTGSGGNIYGGSASSGSIYGGGSTGHTYAVHQNLDYDVPNPEYPEVSAGHSESSYSSGPAPGSSGYAGSAAGSSSYSGSAAGSSSYSGSAAGSSDYPSGAATYLPPGPSKPSSGRLYHLEHHAHSADFSNSVEYPGSSTDFYSQGSSSSHYPSRTTGRHSSSGHHSASGHYHTTGHSSAYSGHSLSSSKPFRPSPEYTPPELNDPHYSGNNQW